MPEYNEEEYLDIPRHTFIDERESQYELKIRRLKLLCLALLTLCVMMAGALGGLFYATKHRNYEASEKFGQALGIMENDWFFAEGIENAHERLTDQALKGMTTNEEDPHTSYMTRQEQEEFVQGINRNFVGIGVQFFQLADETPMIERVFKGAPAEEAGVLPGDIIYSVEGILVQGLSNDEIVDLVRGEAGTVVHMQFKRGEEILSINITRREIATTVYGEKEGDAGILVISQFGNSTADETAVFLQEFMDDGIEKLIIDLRDNGGGYVLSLQKTAGLFLDRGAVALIEEDSAGKQTIESVAGKRIWNTAAPIIILVNEGTASAAEAFTLALKEQRDNVTVLGTVTYGKGTAQVSYPLGDGSYLKYTYAKWLSPGGNWINGTGITPDEVVELPYILNITAYTFTGEDDIYRHDSVGQAVQIAQYALEYLGYEVDRTDGYFSAQTERALYAFAQDKDYSCDGTLDEDLLNQLIQAVLYDWMTEKTHDTQFQRAMEILNG